MAKYTCKKYMGDDLYSWAVFKDGRPVATGMGQHQARWLRDQFKAQDAKPKTKYEPPPDVRP